MSHRICFVVMHSSAYSEEFDPLYSSFSREAAEEKIAQLELRDAEERRISSLFRTFDLEHAKNPEVVISFMGVLRDEPIRKPHYTDGRRNLNKVENNQRGDHAAAFRKEKRQWEEEAAAYKKKRYDFLVELFRKERNLSVEWNPNEYTFGHSVYTVRETVFIDE